MCGERFLRARAFNDSRFRFRSETILWQRSTALQRTENGENGRLFASRGFPPISLSRRPSLSLSLSVFSPGKKENLIARPFNGPRHDKMRLCSLFLHVMYYFFSFFSFPTLLPFFLNGADDRSKDPFKIVEKEKKKKKS